MKLSTKFLLFVIPAISLSLFLLGLVAYTQLKETTEEKLLARMANQVSEASTLLQSKTTQAIKDGALIANLQLLKKYMVMADEDQRLLLLYPAMIRSLGAIQNILPEYFEIRIILPDGYEEVRSVTESIPNETEQEYETELFRRMRDSDKTSVQVLTNPDTGGYTLYAARPIKLRDPYLDTINATPTLRGYLVISVSLHDLQKLIVETLSVDRGFVAAYLPNGHRVFASSPAAIPSLPARYLEGDTTIFRDNHYVYYKSTGDQLLHFVSIIHTSEITSATNQLARKIALITGMTLLGITILLYMLMRLMVINPIEMLIEMSKKVSTGNLEVRNPHHKEDEFGNLGDSFERMAENLKKNSEQIKIMAFRDSLTGTPNRAMFSSYIKRVTARAERNNEQYALLFIDVDNFKTINDTKGHEVGDILLRDISARLESQIRNSDFLTEDITGSNLIQDSANLLARLGGDEFTVLLPDLKDPLIAGKIAQRMIDVISRAFVINGEKLYVGASIGITVYPIDSKDDGELLRFADIAMYHAKQNGKNNYQFYQESFNEKIQKTLGIETRLREATANNSLYLEYQPQVELKTGKVVGVEALLRWNDRVLGKMGPAEFIPIAENCGEIIALGDWVINEACRQQAEWIKAGITGITMSVNVSSIQFERQDVSQIVESALQYYQVPPEMFEVEITESTTMNDPVTAIVKLNKVRDIGISIALDDFGMGFSSLSHLLQFPINVLKIDRQFVLDILTKKNSLALVQTIIAMAHNLDMMVIAEGVEEWDQVDLLASLECDVIQGYVFSRPLGKDKIPDFIVQQNSLSLSLQKTVKL